MSPSLPLSSNISYFNILPYSNTVYINTSQNHHLLSLFTSLEAAFTYLSIHTAVGHVFFPSPIFENCLLLPIGQNQRALILLGPPEEADPAYSISINGSFPFFKIPFKYCLITWFLPFSSLSYPPCVPLNGAKLTSIWCSKPAHLSLVCLYSVHSSNFPLVYTSQLLPFPSLLQHCLTKT